MAACVGSALGGVLHLATPEVVQRRTSNILGLPCRFEVSEELATPPENELQKMQKEVQLDAPRMQATKLANTTTRSIRHFYN